MSGANEAVAGTGGDAGGAVTGAGYGAPVLQRERPALVDLAIVFLFASLLIDGFPLGAAAVREFGARPTNFLLLIAWMVLLARRVMRRRAVGLERRASYLLVAILVGVPLLNLPVAIMQSSVGAGLAVTDWVKQFLMLGWGLASYYIWRRIIAGMDARHYCALISISAAFLVIVFFLAYVDSSGSVLTVINVVRLGGNDRPASLATEPSIYGAWIAFIWPLVLYYSLAGGRALGRLAARVLLAAAFVSALLSEARTFVVVLLLQLLYLSYWAIQRRHGWGARVRSLLLAVCVTVAAVLVLASRLMTVVNIARSESDITRFGDTVAGINVSVAHPLVGVGIGEFGNFFAQYAPTWALESAEVRRDVTGAGPYRTSTFNMFVRLCVEFGIPLGILFSVLILRPVFTAPKRAMGERFVLYAALSAAGGVGFWLSQDTYSYQPAILAMVVLSASLAGTMRGSGSGGIAAARKG